MNTSSVCICMLVVFTGCLRDEDHKRSFSGYEPRLDPDGWEVSTPLAENMDPDLLRQAYTLVYREDRFIQAKSLLVIRNGKLVAEAYPSNENDKHRIENIQSCTKSITSLAVGAAINKGLISDLDEKLYDVFPELFDDDTLKRTISVTDALTMRTGLDFDNATHTHQLYKIKSNSTRFVLSREQLFNPGIVMHYNDGDPHLISAFLERRTGNTLEDFVAREIFEPLDISHWKWETAHDGTTFGAFSLFLKPRDLAKLGQLMLREGSWHGKQLIDRGYLKAATTAQVEADYNGAPFGYYFWIRPSSGGYFASGHGGQFMMVDPAHQLVIVYTASPYTGETFFDQKNELMDLIVASCK